MNCGEGKPGTQWGIVGRLIFLMLAVVSAAPARGAGLSDTPTTSTWVTNGPVYAIATTSSTVYLGGQFTQVGPATGSGVPLSAATGKPADAFPMVKGIVLVCVSDSAGGWYIGGDFNQVGGMPRNNLAHILADGSVDPDWNPCSDDSVQALAVSGATVYVGGAFTTVGGQARNRLAALDAATGAVKAWNPNATGMVFALAVSGGVVYAGGSFSSIGGQTRNNLAALDAASGALLAWNPNADMWVSTLAVSSGVVYACGDFTTIGGQTRHYLAALNATSGAATSWNANVMGYSVDAMAISGGIVYVGGDFTNVGGQRRDNIAAVNATSGAVTTWNPYVTANVNALAVLGGTIYYATAGYFDMIDGLVRSKLAALDASSGMATAWNPPTVIGSVYTVAAAGGTVYVGGNLSCLGGQIRNNIAALDARTGVLTAWAPEANGTVQTLAVSDGVVFAGGDFTRIGGQSRSRLAALNTTNGAAIAAWNPGTINNNVLTLAAAGDTLYAGGDFTSVGGQARNYLAALDAGTGAVKSWSPSANGSVKALTVSAGTVYAGGAFTSVSGQTRNHLAALDASGGNVTTWNPNCDGVVYALAASGGRCYVGGDFKNICGQYHVNLAALDASGGVNASGFGGWGPVHALAIAGGTLFVGGENWHVPGHSYPTLKAIDIASGATRDWRPIPEVGDYMALITIQALAVAGATTVYVGGDFIHLNQLDGPIQPYFARFDTDPPTAAPTNPGAAALETDSIDWTWDYAAKDADGFKIWADPGTAAPTTLRATAAGDAAHWTMSGLAANTQYTFQVAATNAAGDSARSAPYTTWTLIQPVTALTFPSVSATALEVEAAGTFSNLTAGLSGVYFSNDTQGTASGWVQSTAPWVRWVSSGLTPNTLYAFRARSRNGARISGAGASASQWTLAAASIGNNLVCDKAPGPAVRGVGTSFTFSNPAGFGAGTHGGSAYKVSSYRWLWDTTPTNRPGAGDTLWNSGVLIMTPTIAGAYYLHLAAYNGAGAAQTDVLHYGPFTVADAGRLTTAPAMLSFLERTGWEVDVERGGAPTVRSLTLTNTGGLPVVFTGGGSGTPGLALAGRCAGDYTIQSVTPATGAPLAPGGSVTVTIRFAPAETRRTLGLDAALRVTCDSPQTPSFDILLLGDAVPVGLAGFRVE